jgi:hypothetical protein
MTPLFLVLHAPQLREVTLKIVLHALILDDLTRCSELDTLDRALTGPSFPLFTTLILMFGIRRRFAFERYIPYFEDDAKRIFSRCLPRLVARSALRFK